MLLELKSKDTGRVEKNRRLTFTTRNEGVEQLSNKYFLFQTLEVYLSCS